MKIIHTADWHIGADLYGHDRSRDHEHFFDFLQEVMRREQPDALLVSGDVFDRYLPSQSAQRLLVDRLLELEGIATGCQIVITAGNHDSATRLEVLRPLWQRAGIHVIGQVSIGRDGLDSRKHIIELPHCGYVIALPYISTTFRVQQGGVKWDLRAIAQHLLDQVAAQNTQGLPVVMMGHAAVSGGDYMGHKHEQRSDSSDGQREIVGSLEVLTEDSFGHGYDYLALGHIHRPQYISSHGRISYAGAPLPISFDEDFPHSISIVTLDHHHTTASLRRLPTPTLRPLLTVPAQPMELEEVLEALEGLSGDTESFVRVNLAIHGVPPVDAEQRIAAALLTKPLLHLTTIKYTNMLQAQPCEIDTMAMYRAVRDADPIEVATYYLRSRGISDPEATMYIEMVEQIWREEQMRERDDVDA